MINSYDLGMETETLAQQLNDPRLRLISCKVRCSETGYTTAVARFEIIPEPRDLPYFRYVRRFLLFNGVNAELTLLLANRKAKLRNKYEFMTEQGAIIVVDYEMKNERS